MEAHEIFGRVAAHLLSQNARSERLVTTEKGTFMRAAYRGDEDRACSIGALMTDAAWHPDLEGHAVIRPRVVEALTKSGIDVEAHRALLMELQDLHDCKVPEQWSAELVVIAKFNGFEFDPGGKP